MAAAGQRQQEQRPSWYQVLGVPQSASADAIKQAFRQAALRLHPDKASGASAASAAAAGLTAGGSGGEGADGAAAGAEAAEAAVAAAAAAEEFFLVQQAWEVLQDAERRAAYDRQLALAAAAADVHVNETVLLSDLAPEDLEGQACLAWPCRCGGSYLLLAEDAAALEAPAPAAAAGSRAGGQAGGQAPCQAAELLVPCSTCSLHIRVVAGQQLQQ